VDATRIGVIVRAWILPQQTPRLCGELEAWFLARKKMDDEALFVIATPFTEKQSESAPI